MATDIFDDGSNPDLLPTSPTLLLELDDELEGTTLSAPVEPVTSYGRDVSIDWGHPDGPRTRMLPGGQDPHIATGQTALAEAITKALLTERYNVPIYSDQYGSELRSLAGRDMPLVLTLIPNMVEEALLQDDRLDGVEDISVTAGADGSVRVTFSVRDFTGEVFRAPAFIAWYGG